MLNPDIPEDFEIPAIFRYSGIFEILADAAFQHRLASTEVTSSYIMNRYARASILASALSVECVANCLIAALDLPKAEFDLVDRDHPLGKIKAYCKRRRIKGFDKGALVSQRIEQLLKARNEHVHSKQVQIPAGVRLPRDGGDKWLVPFSFEGDFWGQLNIPRYALVWASRDSRTVLAAVLDFLTHLFTKVIRLSHDELGEMFLPRVEFANILMPAVFDEVRTELLSLSDLGFDTSVLHLMMGEPPRKIEAQPV